MSKLFVVTTIYQENGGRADQKLVGVFDTHEKAQAALETAFHENCDALDIEELNKNSFFDDAPEEGMPQSFYLCDENEEDWFCMGSIAPLELNKVYAIDDKYEPVGDDDDKPEQGGVDDKEVYKQVESLKELIDTIQSNEDEGEGPVEVVIRLNGGALSRKLISFADEDDKFEVFNFIDETTQILSADELFDRTKTNIGKALEVGALYYVLF